MAYMNQERKAKLAANLKKVMPKGWKYTVAVRHHSGIVVTISEAPVDIIGAAKQGAPCGQTSINPYHYQSHLANHPKLVAEFDKIFTALNDGNHDRSDIQSDYFDVGWYVYVEIGKWDKPFVCTAKGVTT